MKTIFTKKVELLLFMKRLVINYALLVISTLVLSSLLTKGVLLIWPDLLTSQMSDGFTSFIRLWTLEWGITFLLNIIIVYELSSDMKKENLKSIPILVMTLFSSVAGVILFLLAVSNTKINSNN